MLAWLQHQWFKKSSPHLLLRLFAALFSCLIHCRYWAYRKGLLKTQRVSVPVVVVGNLTLGGTGKTPLVIFLVQALMRQGLHPAVLSRGYQGSAKIPQRVYAHTDTSVAGDEPVMLAQQLSCPVWIGRRRADAARELLDAHTDVDVIICDDGLQHYALARDLEVVVFDAERGVGNGFLFPAGPLREPLARLRCADIAVFNGEVVQDKALIKMLESLTSFTMRLNPADAISLSDPKQHRSIKSFKHQPITAIAGIGHPERFFKQLRQHDIQVNGLSFPDHHAYVQADFAGLDNTTLMMTEKDAVKCRHLSLGDAWYLPVTAEVSQQLVKLVIQKIKAKREAHG
jgi:tetraacyldisaccharide 4'-kinase